MDQRDRVNGDRFTGAGGIDTFVRLSFDADLRRLDPEGARQACADGIDVRRQLRPLRDDDDVNVPDRIARAAYHVGRTGQQLDAVRAFERGIGIWKVAA